MTMSIDMVRGTCLETTRCDCGEQHYVNEPCPSCTMGNIEAVTERLEASLRREQFLLMFADRLLRRLATAAVDRGRES